MKKRVIFIHLVKTAGLSLQTMLLEVFPESKCLAGKTFGPGDIIKLNKDKGFDKYSLIMGHFDFTSISEEVDLKKYNIVSMLRDPLKRFLSNYYYYKAHVDTFGHHIDVDISKKISFDMFLDYINNKKTTNFWNHMTYMIVGYRKYNVWRKARELIRSDILWNLYIKMFIIPTITKIVNKYAYIGIVEDFNNSVSQIFKKINKEIPDTKHINSLEQLSKNHPNFIEIEQENLTEERLNMIMSALELDNILYSIVKKRFHNSIDN